MTRLWWHKLIHWEYWSEKIVYAPTILLWIGYAIKFRSFSFYKYSNPGICNGGLYGDSKYEIYNILPQGTYPKTILIKTRKENDYKNILLNHKLDFPLIVKPDIGCRGIGVQKVHNYQQLIDYSKSIRKNFLIQNIIEFPNELGLFYRRIPNEPKGKIIGITLKKFLTVEGNGRESIEQLLKKDKRFEMQIPTLKKGIDLSEILPLGEKRCLVPFGNHNRGTEFIDGTAKITPQLEATFDALLRNVEGFYYGRLDIRYNSFEEIEKGINFSIIELNGAKSEPTHIYDKRYSFWKGQKEIFKYQKIFKRIISVNRKKYFKGLDLFPTATSLLFML